MLPNCEASRGDYNKNDSQVMPSRRRGVSAGSKNGVPITTENLSSLTFSHSLGWLPRAGTSPEMRQKGKVSVQKDSIPLSIQCEDMCW
jgi:hypothetical protein